MGWFTTLSLLVSLLLMVSCKKNGQLPGNIVPENYNLEIITHLADDEHDKFTFEGKVIIRVRCVEPTDKIILNVLDLEIIDNSVIVDEVGTDKQVNDVNEWCQCNENETLSLSLDRHLKPNHTYDISIRFTGNISDGLSGYYRSSYVDSMTNERRWLAVTQFEPTDARRAFPCFDEPNMKATFQISLGRLAKYSSISNMPIERTEPIKEREGWFWDRFQKSVPMSTYIVAYMVSDFNSTLAPRIPNSDVTFRIWSREEAMDQVDFAAEVGPRALAFFENFFNITYPLPKQDMIAVPDFSAGAMENWGLITYREYLLLFNPKTSSLANKFSIASVVAHELAHQWFGNLVTMKWWTDLWLNEGFATYMASLAVHNLYPKWKTFDEETVSNMMSVFSFDSLKNSHPVSVPIENPKDIKEIFDTISYDKGSHLLFMMANFLGDETFRRGVSNYLERHKYGNAEQDDLWESLTIEAHRNGALPEGLSVKTIMDTWTLQTGYPIVTVNRNYDDNSVQVSQERYYRDFNASHNDECWWIPLSYTDQSEQDFENRRPRDWLSCPKTVKTISNICDEDEWIILNIRAAGLYRINYDERNWGMLVSTLNSDSYTDIPILNRVQLIEDSADLAATSKLNYKVFFDILRYLNKETEYLPWRAATGNIRFLYSMLRYSSSFGSFKEYMKRILEPAYKRIGALRVDHEDEDRLDRINYKTLILSNACNYEAEACINETKRMFSEYVSNPDVNLIPNDFRSSIYCNAMRHGGEREWTFLWNKYKESGTAGEKQLILQSLGCTNTIWLLQRYLEWTLDESSGIRKQDAITVFGSVARNDIGYSIAKSFFENNIKKIYESSKPNTNKLSRYLSVIAKQVVSEREYNELKQFIDQHSEIFSELRKGVQQALESAELNIQWQMSHLNHVKDLLI
ncbi:aminopeptidase N [Agrilus planipennis]|uniref:Aminopeptidase n=1 Tax=Agrilus planipennis TaxID=224129 RepID=A0A1W4XNR6_AGRPL|nr:aminopeptidase N [Agrilus planipennis]